MKNLNFTKETGIISLVFFSMYMLYGIFNIPFVQYLVSISIGGIAYGIFNSYEIAIIALLFMNLIYPFVGPVPIKHEGYIVDPMEISKRIGNMKKNPVKGVGSQMSEGFEDAETTDMTLNENKEETKNTEDVTATSKPAAAKPEKKAEEPANEENKVEGAPTDNGLFKLGQIPADVEGGFHIDAGTTVVNALKALKPDQIMAMTQDTKQLIETQKALMGMLQTFAPMVNEGKQMMDTFGSMFNGVAGAGVSAGEFNLGSMAKPPSA